jgi:hypothetical protein
VRPLLLLKSDTVTRRSCIAGANQTSNNPLFGQLLVVVQGSDAGDELDASSLGIEKSLCLPGLHEVSGWQASCRLLFALAKEKSSIFVTTA